MMELGLTLSSSLLVEYLSRDGSFALIGEYSNNLIRHIVISTGEVSTLAGSPHNRGYLNGIGTQATFNYPIGVSISPDNTYALVADHDNHAIRKIILSTSEVINFVGGFSSGYQDGIGTNVKLYYPIGIDISFDESFTIVSEYGNSAIRKIILSTGSVSLLAGNPTVSSGYMNGKGTNAKFESPCQVSISPVGIFVLVADHGNHAIRKIIISTGDVSVIAGGYPIVSGGYENGVGTNSKFNYPSGVIISSDESFALVGDCSEDAIRRIDLISMEVATISGSFRGSSNGMGTDVKFDTVREISLSHDLAFALIVDLKNHQIRKISLVPNPALKEMILRKELTEISQFELNQTVMKDVSDIRADLKLMNTSLAEMIRNGLNESVAQSALLNQLMKEEMNGLSVDERNE